MDAIGQAYVDWVLSSDDLPDFVNVVHPCPVAWDVVLHGVCDELHKSLPVVPLAEWISKVERAMQSSSLDQMAEIVRSTTELVTV